MKRLDPCRSVVLLTKEKQPKKAILTKFKKSCPSSIMKLLKLNADAAKERVIKTAKNTLEESNPGLAKFVEEIEKEIKARNQSNNRHLDNKLVRIRKKLKYGALVTKGELFKWKITDNNNCSFCGLIEESLDHLLIECEALKTLWEGANNITKKKWKITPSILDKRIGLKTSNEGNDKAEKLFLRIVWRLWGIKHNETNHEKVVEEIERIKDGLDFYAEIMNHDTKD